MADGAVAKQRIGLLVVHGIGEQKRFEYLKSIITQFAEILRQREGPCRISTVDRTESWKALAGEPELTGDAPMTLSFGAANKQVDFECHEVWWADLGAKTGLLDVVAFWIWGLGQWGAPIYQDLEASGMRRHREKNRPFSVMPSSIAGLWHHELFARFGLFWAGFAAIFTLFSLTLLKRVFSKLLGTAPSPTLIEQYVGDVRIFEQRARPGRAHPSDPGMPLRVAIRRRMMTEMAAMSARCAKGDYDGWYLVAHSLGTVVAYNGLTEIGHTLPNYLPQRLWSQLRYHFSDLNMAHPTPLRKELSAMMPARPAWLADGDAINRQKLFASLRGVLTFGSPLQKFAALWPRIIATSMETAETNPFGKHHPQGRVDWINLTARNDPVAGILEGFKADRRLANSLPRLASHFTRFELFAPGLAHVRYFSSGERFGRCKLVMRQK
jgi:hypothetical protein